MGALGALTGGSPFQLQLPVAGGAQQPAYVRGPVGHPNPMLNGFLDMDLAIVGIANPNLVITSLLTKASVGGIDYTPRALACDDSEVNREVIGYVDALAAHGIEVLSVFTEKCPVYTL